ncbi:glycosyltransferase family 2 protein [Candidatus Latescibacterota bacterium]
MIEDNFRKKSIRCPKVTICVPVRNGARTIRRTLDSILAQDYPNFEVIVSDNCSDDNTADIVREFKKKGVQYYYNPKLEEWADKNWNCAESNWNFVLSLAKGPFVALYHADDLYSPTIISKQIDFLLNHPHASAVFTTTQPIDDFDYPIPTGTTRRQGELLNQNEFDFKDSLNGVMKYLNFFVVPTLMVRKDALEKVGLFNCQFGSADDIDLWLRLSQLGTIGLIDEPLHHYRISEHQGSASSLKLRTYRAHFLQAIEHYLSNPEYRKMVNPQSFSYYKMHIVTDDIIRATNMFFIGNVAEARALMKSALSRPEFREGLRTKYFAKRFLISLPLFLAFQLGLRKLLYMFYNKLYRPWHRYGRWRLYKKEKI